jgi:hypothetical protein
LFFQLEDGQARHIQELLKLFEKGMGHMLSLVKLSLLVWEGANQDLVNHVKTILNVARADFDAKYLGLPMPEGQLMCGVFKSIEERYAKRMLD